MREASKGPAPHPDLGPPCLVQMLGRYIHKPSTPGPLAHHRMCGGLSFPSLGPSLSAGLRDTHPQAVA